MGANPNLKTMYSPCQPWDSPLGIATSLLHRIGITEESEDPYKILETLPYKPAARLEIDAFRSRLTAHLLDENYPPNHTEGGGKTDEIIVVLDDVHNIGASGDHLFGALLQTAEKTQLRLLMISRTSLAFYDRRYVHTLDKVSELALSGLSPE